MKPTTDNKLNGWQVALVTTVILLGIAGYGIYKINERAIALENDLKTETAEKNRLATELGIAKANNLNLQEETRSKQKTIDAFKGQIEDISDTVSDLDKLAKIDKELLRKYSKVFFLNENYVPDKLTQVEAYYAFDDAGGKNFLIHADVWPHLRRLLDDARRDGVELRIASAFRSFGTQASLKSEYSVVYGAGTANQFSADQGYSEHQLGTSVDFTTMASAGDFSKFRADPAYKWLLDNAHRYGFVLSYPEGNAYYKFEPWHWRFVGVELAETLEDDGKYFYDLDQREIDTYLIKLFD